MRTAQNDQEWEELLRDVLPEVPVPPDVTQNAQALIRLEITRIRMAQQPGHAAVKRLAPPTWLQTLPSLLNRYFRSPARVWLAAAALFAVVIAAALIAGGTPPQPAVRASLHVDDGQVAITRASTGETLTLSTGDVSYVEPGDDIRTGAGTATVTSFSEQVTQVSPGAHVKLISLTKQGDAQHVQFAVLQGRVLVKLSPAGNPENSVEIVSPSSTASIRSADAAVVVDVRSDTETHYEAAQGTASVTMGDQSVVVRAGQEVNARTGSVMSIASIPTTHTPTPTVTSTLTITPEPTETPLSASATTAPSQMPSPPEPSSPTPSGTQLPSPTVSPDPEATPFPDFTDTPYPSATALPAHTQVPNPTSTATATQPSTPIPPVVNTPPPTPVPTQVPPVVNTPQPTAVPLPTEPKPIKPHPTQKPRPTQKPHP